MNVYWGRYPHQFLLKLVETVKKMSTEVDLALGSDIERLFETVSGMSTKVDWRYQES